MKVYLVFYEESISCWQCDASEQHTKLEGVYADENIAKSVAKTLFLGSVREQEVLTAATIFD